MLPDAGDTRFGWVGQVGHDDPGREGLAGVFEVTLRRGDMEGGHPAQRFPIRSSQDYGDQWQVGHL